jgi:hypothetical protein
MMKNSFAYLTVLATLTFFSEMTAQSQSSYDSLIVDLPKMKYLTMSQQEELFTNKLGEPDHVISFWTATKYKNGKQRKVKCDQFRYPLVDAQVTCFYFADTHRLGEVVFQLVQGNVLSDFRELFALFNIRPPDKLGKRQGAFGFYWYHLDNYEGFTRITVGEHLSGFNEIDFYIDRIE